MRGCRAGIAVLAGLATLAAAAADDTGAWPPSAAVAARMHELQQEIADRASSAAQRESARDELSGLLRSPAGRLRERLAGDQAPRPARAAIDPFPSVVRPLEVAPAPPIAGVARVEIVVPPKPIVNPRTGSVAIPSAGFAIDPLTGQVLHDAGAGFIDPRTGIYLPK